MGLGGERTARVGESPGLHLSNAFNHDGGRNAQCTQK